MKFLKFASLDNTYKERHIKDALDLGLGNVQWVVFEKVDGANFSFWYDGVDLRIASRTQFVDEGFYKCGEVVEKYAPLIKKFYHTYGLTGHTLTVYGELYGDNIQKRVAYGPKDFASFDILVDGEPQSKNYLLEFSNLSGVPMAPILAVVDSLQEALDYENTFKSKLTPKGHEGDNFAEGTAISPTEPEFFNTGSRVWFKNKSEMFAEVRRKKAVKVEVSLSDGDKDLLSTLLSYVNSSRVLSVISKVGEVSFKDFGKLQGLTVQDVLEEYENDTEQNAPKQAENWKAVQKELTREVQKVIREILLKEQYK